MVAAHPREGNFKEAIIDAFAQGTIHKPETTFGNVKADVLALKHVSSTCVTRTSKGVNGSYRSGTAMCREYTP